MLRAWLEPDRRLRVRVIATPVDGVGIDRHVAASVDDACAIVRSWLEELSR